MITKLKSSLLENKSDSQIIAKNAFWLFFSQAFGRGIRAITIILAARMLGASEYGLFSYALGLAGFFTLFADVGISQVLTRNATQNPASARAYFATAFWMKVVLLVLTALAIIFIAPYFSNINGSFAIIPLVALIVVFDNLKDFWGAYFRSQEKMEREALVTIVTNVGIALLCFVALIYGKSAQSVTLAYMGSVFLGTLTGIVLLREEFVRVISHFKKEYVGEILHAAWATAIIGLLGAFMLNIDIVILGLLTSARDIGLYAAAQKIVLVLYLIPSILASAIFPVLARGASGGDEKSVRTLMEKALRIVFFVAVPLAIGGMVFGAPIILFVFGQEYIPSTLTFQILMATILFVFPGTLVGNFILAHHKQKEIAPYVGAAALLNVILDFALIIPFGIAGSAVATLIVAIIYNILMGRFAVRTTRFNFFTGLKNPIIAGLSMAIIGKIIYLLGVSILPTILISAICYLLVIMILKDPVIAEIKNLRRKIVD